MGRIIRRTVTITITETWTIVWTDDVRAGDTAQPQATTIVQGQPKPQEEEEKTILPAVTTVTATEPHPKAGRQRKGGTVAVPKESKEVSEVGQNRAVPCKNQGDRDV